MKNFKFTGDQLTPSLRDKIADGDLGIYVVYGAFIDGTSLNLTRLYKGEFKDIMLRIEDPTNVNPDNVEYLLPVPEYIVAHDDTEYAKYLNIHLVPSSDIEDDEVMLRKFCEAYTRKLSEVGANEESGTEAAAQVEASGQSLTQMEETLTKLQESTSLLATLQAQTNSTRVSDEEDVLPTFPSNTIDDVTDVTPKD